MLIEILLGILATLCIIFVMIYFVAKIKKRESIYKSEPEQQNPLEGKMVQFVEDETYKENADGVRGYLTAVGESSVKTNLYDMYIKRVIDLV